jgi:hypothetical protein
VDLPVEPAASVVLIDRPPVPRRGLEETLRSWTGQGQLWEALGATGPPQLVADRKWTPTMVRRRAHRVLFERLHTTLASWPTDQRAWLDALPASSETFGERTSVPGPGISWTQTRVAGWPPRHFVGRRRRRVPETLLSTITRWTLDQLEPVLRDGSRPGDEMQHAAVARATIALSLLEIAPLDRVAPSRPTTPDLAAVAAEGQPWRSLVPVARELLRVDAIEALADLALDVVAPFDDLSGRLFHLAILGEVLYALRTCGATVVSRHPLGDASPGPAYLVTDADDREWDLWFEAAGAWNYYDVGESYPQAAAGVPGAGSALGTDLMLIRPRESALLLECKHSRKPSVVARDGYLQAVAYATEAFELAPQITSVVVGPEGVVQRSGWADTMVGLVGIIPPDDVPALIEHALGT